MAKPKASLAAALAQKPAPAAPAAGPPPAPAAARPAKADDGNIKTSLVLKRDDLAELKVLALKRRVTVNDLIQEAVHNLLALNGRRTAA